ncbi:tRNA N6-adenosine threonylcarbamoyltransferase [Candidatus Phycosocius spiralis]|uniref:tRNA N6-adenosine threonylcarbamoyltransferase n=1 Tax=Candidatus Phycosocius spiralis TaxID=2815099 RepID=A0ABQ4PX20_9PROT|nr:tRNA N6-adenosine threonylcarbamoyltransferase [Candidatus Phycosocius spiralis]
MGLESSCDETAAAVVVFEAGHAYVASSIIASQIEAHAPYGGVVPEIAARAHVAIMDQTVLKALEQAQLGFTDLTGVAATAGPGLIGGVMVGLLTAKAIALAQGLPMVGVNHLEGHALSPRLEADVPFPYLLLLVSGGHCQLLAVKGVGDYQRLGSTIDDAVGEAFDKTAKILGLAYPGGPAVEHAAQSGDPKRFDLPRPLKGRPGCDFSFAGLKTAVARAAAILSPLSAQDINDMCASFQAAIGDVLVDRTRQAMASLPLPAEVPGRFVVAGGVAANETVRARLKELCDEQGWSFFAPALDYCGDNAAMIALAGAERLALGLSDGLGVHARSRWPLDGDAAHAAPKFKTGRKGPKV